MSEKITTAQAEAASRELLDHFHCEECNDSGVVVLGEHIVTREMALDAGEPSMEGMSMGFEEGPCHRCGGAEAQQRILTIRAYLAQQPSDDVVRKAHEALDAIIGCYDDQVAMPDENARAMITEAERHILAALPPMPEEK